MGDSTAQADGSLPGDPQIDLVKVAGGLADPVNVASAKDGSGRLFIVERTGTIRILQDGAVLDEPFLDISRAVKTDFGSLSNYGVRAPSDRINGGQKQSTIPHQIARNIGW